MNVLSVTLAARAGLAWAQRTVTQKHYRPASVDARGRPLAYLVHHPAIAEPVGVLMLNRPEATTTRPLWGSLADLAAGRVRYSYWSIINLCRVWLSPEIQRGGASHVYDAATWAIGQIRRRVVLDYLRVFPPVDCSFPWRLDLMVSYAQPAHHAGTIYKAAGFTRARVNDEGLETYTCPLRGLQPHARRQVLRASETSQRSRAQRSWRATAGVVQLALAEVGV